MPITLNIVHKRTMHNVTVNFAHGRSRRLNRYAFVKDVAGNAGVTGRVDRSVRLGGAAALFLQIASLRDVTPSTPHDARLTLGYGWTRPSRSTRSGSAAICVSKQREPHRQQPNGAFVFTGLYTSGGVPVRCGGLDFADFLLGLPQQAALQYGPGNVDSRGKSMSLYLQDDWRKSVGPDVQPRACATSCSGRSSKVAAGWSTST